MKDIIVDTAVISWINYAFSISGISRHLISLKIESDGIESSNLKLPGNLAWMRVGAENSTQVKILVRRDALGNLVERRRFDLADLVP